MGNYTKQWTVGELKVKLEEYNDDSSLFLSTTDRSSIDNLCVVQTNDVGITKICEAIPLIHQVKINIIGNHKKEEIQKILDAKD